MTRSLKGEAWFLVFCVANALAVPTDLLTSITLVDSRPAQDSSPENVETPQIDTPAEQDDQPSVNITNYQMPAVLDKLKAQTLILVESNLSGTANASTPPLEFNGSSVTRDERLKTCFGKCGEGLHLFTAWTTPASGWTSKYTHSIDSALYFHPKAKVTIYSSSLPVTFFEPFAELGYDVSVKKLNLKERAQDTPLEAWTEHMGEFHTSPYYYAQLSDAVRLVVLYDEGGVYFDTDVIFVNPMDTATNVIAWERTGSICNAVMSFEAKNPYILACMKAFTETFRTNDWRGPGNGVVTSVYEDFKDQREVVQALDSVTFYPISWERAPRYFEEQSDEETANDLNTFRRLSYTVHFWNSVTHDLAVHPKSLLGRMFSTYCVLCKPLFDVPEQVEVVEAAPFVEDQPQHVIVPVTEPSPSPSPSASASGSRSPVPSASSSSAPSNSPSPTMSVNSHQRFRTFRDHLHGVHSE